MPAKISCSKPQSSQVQIVSCPHVAAALFYTRKLSFETYMKSAAWPDDSKQQITTHHCWTELTGWICKLPESSVFHFTAGVCWGKPEVVYLFLPPYATKVLSDVRITAGSSNLILVTSFATGLIWQVDSQCIKSAHGSVKNKLEFLSSLCFSKIRK